MKTLEKITHWHQAWLNGEDMNAACFKEIALFLQDSHYSSDNTTA